MVDGFSFAQVLIFEYDSSPGDRWAKFADPPAMAEFRRHRL